MEILLVLGAIVNLIGISSYIFNTIKGRTKPNRVTWLLWSVAPMIAFFAALSEGITWGAIPTFMSGFGPLLVFISSFLNKKAYWKLTSTDYICGAMSVIALILWAITKEANLAIVFAILSDGLAAIPTLIKARKDPFSETITPYIIGMIFQSFTFMTVKNWEFSEFGFSLYLIIINFILTSTILLRKKQFKEESN